MILRRGCADWRNVEPSTRKIINTKNIRTHAATTDLGMPDRIAESYYKSERGYRLRKRKEGLKLPGAGDDQ
jgi:hypothetical protein